MASKGKDLTEDLNAFHTNLIKTREMTSVLEVAFQKLNTQIHSINASGRVSAAIDPIKRKIRCCKETVSTATESARCQQEVSATYIEQGRFGDALTAINEGLIVLGGLKKPLVGIRDSLNSLAKGRTIVTDALKQIGFDKEIQAWDAGVNEWTARLAMPTWRI
jgi:hypothetical protein